SRRAESGLGFEGIDGGQRATEGRVASTVWLGAGYRVAAWRRLIPREGRAAAGLEVVVVGGQAARVAGDRVAAGDRLARGADAVEVGRAACRGGEWSLGVAGLEEGKRVGEGRVAGAVGLGVGDRVDVQGRLV